MDSENKNGVNDSWHLLMKESSKLPTGIGNIFAGVNIFFSITATLGNVLILVALYKVSSVQLHAPTRLLLRSLTVTDLCVGVVTQPLFVLLLLYPDFITKVKIFIPISLAQSTLSYTLCPVSFFTATAMTIDRFLALRLRLRYRNVVNLPRVRVAIALCWLIGIYYGLTSQFWSLSITLRQIAVSFGLWMFISLSSYTMICLTLREQRVQVHENNGPLSSNSGILPSRLAIYKKTLSGIAWVQLVLAACYFPFVILVIIIMATNLRGEKANILRMSAVTLIYFNSSVNPVLYCWKMKQVRRAAKITVLHVFCCSSSKFVIR